MVDPPQPLSAEEEGLRLAALLNEKMDRKIKRAREMVIFMEETKIWQTMLAACSKRNRVSAYADCRHFYDILAERVKYYDSHYDSRFLPTLSPGLPEDCRFIEE